MKLNQHPELEWKEARGSLFSRSEEVNLEAERKDTKIERCDSLLLSPARFGTRRMRERKKSQGELGAKQQRKETRHVVPLHKRGYRLRAKKGGRWYGNQGGKPVSIHPAVTSVCPRGPDRGNGGLPLLVRNNSQSPFPPFTGDNKDLQTSFLTLYLTIYEWTHFCRVLWAPWRCNYSNNFKRFFQFYQSPLLRQPSFL